MNARKFRTIAVLFPALLFTFSIFTSCEKNAALKNDRISHQLEGTWKIAYLTGQKGGRPIILRTEDGQKTPDTEWDAAIKLYENEILKSDVFTKSDEEQKRIIGLYNANFKNQLTWLSNLELTVTASGTEGTETKELTFTFKNGEETHTFKGTIDGFLQIENNGYPVADENNFKDWWRVKAMNRFLTQTALEGKFNHKRLTVLTTASYVINNIVQGEPVDDAANAKRLDDDVINFDALYEKETKEVNGASTSVSQPRDNIAYRWELVFWKE